MPEKPELGLEPRFLGLDVGNRRIGVAVSDELGITAQPVMTLERKSQPQRRSAPPGAPGAAIWRDGDCRRESAASLRRNEPASRPDPGLCGGAGRATGLPIHLWDERLTTQEAHQILYEAGHARQEHRPVVDQVAATLILQWFLDEQGTVNR